MTRSGADAAEAAGIVVESGAVYTRSGSDPVFFSSGWASPVFIDIKRLIALPQARDRLIELALARIATITTATPFQQIAGCELAGVPFAAIIADRLKLPLVVVLKQRKGFGRLAQFEGTFEPGTRTLLIDDLTTDGATKATFRSALEDAEAAVVSTFVLLDYKIFPTAQQLNSLMTLADVITAADLGKHMDQGALEDIRAFAADAPGWSRRHGGIGGLAS